MPARRWLPAVLCLLLAPLAAAGTREAPELLDAPGDWEPAGPSQVAAQVDLLRAWIWGEGPDQMNVTLEVASLDAATTAMYEVSWGWLRPSSEDELFWGLRAHVRNGEAEWGFVSSDMEDLRFAGERPLSDDHGRLTLGTPGNVTWYLYREDEAYSGFLADDDTLDRFRGRAVLGDTFTPMTAASLRDEASTEGTSYAMGDWRLVDVRTFEPPTREPDLTRDTASSRSWSASNGPPGELTGLWIDLEEKAANLTLRVDALNAEALQSCRGGARYTAHVDYSQWSQAKLRGRGEAVKATRSSGASYEGDLRADNVFVAVGEPGHVRIRLEMPGWEGEMDPASIPFSATAQCNGYASLSYDPGLQVPSLAPALALLGLAAAAFAARRRG